LSRSVGYFPRSWCLRPPCNIWHSSSCILKRLMVFRLQTLKITSSK
jgi:hypothetical protein